MRFRAGEERRAAVDIDAVSDTGSSSPATDHAGECASQPSRRTRDRCRARHARVASLVAIVTDEADERVPRFARVALQPLVTQLRELRARIDGFEARLVIWCRSNDASRRLATIPGVGDCRDGDRSFLLQLRETVCSLARARAATELEWRQVTRGPHLKTRRPLYPTPSGRQRPYRYPLCARQGTGRRPVDQGVARSQARPHRPGRACQQDCADRLGHPRAWWDLSSGQRIVGMGSARVTVARNLQG